jgi:predicted nucleic acid-binding protein
MENLQISQRGAASPAQKHGSAGYGSLESFSGGRAIPKIVVSDASPLIQITLAEYLWLLPKLYEVIIPLAVLDEVRFYENLPDAVEIVTATRTWLKVYRVERAERVQRLRSIGLGRGEAEALALYEETNAHALLLTDEDAARKVASLKANPINLADVGREAYRGGILTARELFEYANVFLEQGILLTRYMEDLREEARKWLSKRMSKT